MVHYLFISTREVNRDIFMTIQCGMQMRYPAAQSQHREIDLKTWPASFLSRMQAFWGSLHTLDEVVGGRICRPRSFRKLFIKLYINPR